MSTNPRKSWEKIKMINNGFFGHYKKKILLKFRNKDGNIVKTDSENEYLTLNNFEKALKKDATVDWEHFNQTKTKK